jgi:homoserine acetyltransferase
MNDLPLRPAGDIGAVEDRFFTLRNFPLTDGTVMPEATIAYETYGRLAPPNGPNGGRNAICARMATPPATISPAATRRTATGRGRGTT